MGPRHTHQLRQEGGLITKTYRSWTRDEHRREWAVLNRLAAHHPDTAPSPVDADLESEPPSITMTVIPGEPILGRWDDHQLGLLADTMCRLWSTPVDGLARLDMYEPGYWRELMSRSARPSIGIERQAYDVAARWVAGAEVDSLLSASMTVLGQGDPQPGNLLYDGERIRVVDFEDAGGGDLCFELANFAEHLGTRESGLDRLAALVDHDGRRYRLYRRLLATFWLVRLLPDPAGLRPPRTAELRDQSMRLLDLFDQ